MKKKAVHFILMLIGAVIAAFAVQQILVPVRILDGGVVGVSIIISALAPVPLGLLTIVLNIPFVLFGSRKLEKSFVIKAFSAMAVFSAAVSLFEKYPVNVTDDKLLATVFGGIILGFGVGVVLRYGGCLDGTETVAILISRKTSLSVGQIVLMCNVVIYSVASILFGLDRGMYSLLTYFIVSRVCDFVVTGLDQGKAVMIITNEGRCVADDIYNELGRTVTFMKGEGLISGEKTVLYCVVTRLEIGTIRRIIEQDDVSAFMTVSDVSEIVGHHIKNNSLDIEKIQAGRRENS